MHRQTIPPAMEQRLIEHLRREESVLETIKRLSVGLADGGPGGDSLSDRRGEIEQAVLDLQHVQLERRTLLADLSRCLACPPDQVRLSRIRMRDTPLDATFRQRRLALQALAAETSGSLRSTQRTLTGWNAIVNSVLDVLLNAAGGTVRYSARGERITPTAGVGIDLRS